MAREAPSRTAPAIQIRRSLRWAKGSTLAVGATTVNTPTTCPSHRTGAATCMAEVLESAGSSRVARAP